MSKSSSSKISVNRGAKVTAGIKITSKKMKDTPIIQSNRNYVSLFSGAMGLDIGIERAGFHCVVCNKIDPLAVKTIKLNRPKLPVISTSVEEVTLKSLSVHAGFDFTGIDLIVGGPPCQAFSVFGQRKGLNDRRGRMIFEFLKLIDEVRPKAFLMENVRGLHSMSIIPKGMESEG